MIPDFEDTLIRSSLITTSFVNIKFDHHKYNQKKMKYLISSILYLIPLIRSPVILFSNWKSEPEISNLISLILGDYLLSMGTFGMVCHTWYTTYSLLTIIFR